MVPIQGEWAYYVRSKEYLAKSLARTEKSRVWDKLIGMFTENVLSGTSPRLHHGRGFRVLLSRTALRFRYMAREGRFSPCHEEASPVS